MSRRANGEGTIFSFMQGGKRKWRASVSWRDENGKRRRRSKVANTRADAVLLLNDLRSEVSNRSVREPSQMTVATYLEHWLDTSIKPPNRRDATHDSYSRAVRNQIVPHIGTVRLDAIEPIHVERLLAKLANVGSRTRQNAFVVLNAAFNHAVRLRRLRGNPCDSFDKPKHERKRIFPFTRDEARSILAAIAGSRLESLYLLAFHLGMRQEELFGLHWQSVDFDAATLKVERVLVQVRGRLILQEMPKNDSSNRTLSLAADTLESLLRHRKRVVTEGHAGRPMVFPGRRGAYFSRGNFRKRYWTPLLKRLKLAHRGFHHARHTFATLALSDGVDILAVAQILGHARASTTLNTYAHFLPARNREVAERASRMYG